MRFEVQCLIQYYRCSIYRGTICHDIGHNTTSNLKLRSDFEPTTWASYGCLSLVILRKQTARYRESTVPRRQKKLTAVNIADMSAGQRLRMSQTERQAELTWRRLFTIIAYQWFPWEQSVKWPLSKWTNVNSLYPFYCMASNVYWSAVRLSSPVIRNLVIHSKLSQAFSPDMKTC